MPAKLKVYRTSIGFHDAYVAAPSQAAALKAWGTDKPLFARGAAEVVTDPELAVEPLASPGVVVKRLRGTAEEQVAALPRDRPKAASRERSPKPAKAPAPAKHQASKPKPSRADLDMAERQLREGEARHRQAVKAIEERERAIREERRALERDQKHEVEQLTTTRDRAAAAYESALKRWRG